MATQHNSKYAARTERHEAVKKSIYARIKKLAAEETRLMTGMLKSAYKESYYGLIDDAAKGFDVGINFALLDDDAIEEAIKTKWHGKRFSERIWKNTDRLAEEAQSLVTKALMSGESLTKTAQKLADSFEVEKYHATTLVRTETAHAHAMADLKGYEDLGIEEYKYLATLDYLTCTLCQPLDGMVFKVSEAREGVNYPTLHPRCRCTTTVTGDFDKRSARNPITGKSELIDGNTTYTEWVKNMTPEQRQALELAKRKNERRTSDKLQHEKYKKLLGTKNVPKSFDKFQDLKYNNSELWDDLRKCYREVSWQKECQKIYEKATLHRMPDNSVPNSVIDNYSSSGTILQRRYFGRTGKPRLDIDMTDHGNAKQHPVVPHYHDWFELQSGKVQRSLEHDKALELWHKIANKDILE